MVDSVLQRFARQFNADHLAIRSAKLPINVLLDHWHHVRTTDTVIVVSSYKIYPSFSHHTRSSTYFLLDTFAFYSTIKFFISYLYPVLLSSFVIVFFFFLFFRRTRFSNFFFCWVFLFLYDYHEYYYLLNEEEAIVGKIVGEKKEKRKKSNDRSNYIPSQLRRTDRSGPIDVGRELWLWDLSALRESLAALVVKTHSFSGLRGWSTCRTHGAYVRSGQRGHACSVGYVSTYMHARIWKRRSWPICE